MNRVIRVLLTLLCVTALGRFAYAADNNTEFGIADDLTVFGTGGTNTSDPDVEIKGFTVFGATEPNHALNIPLAPGNIYANGYVQVSSGIYVAGASTFSASVNLPSVDNIRIPGGTPGFALTQSAVGGPLQWTNVSSLALGDGLGSHIATQTLQMSDFGIVNIASVTVNDWVDVGTFLTVGSSATLKGDLGVTGATYLGAAGSRSTFTAVGALNMAANANITLLGTGQITLPNLPSAATDAANKGYVDGLLGPNSIWVRDPANNVVKLSTITDNVGIGIAIPTAKLEVSSANAAGTEMLLAVSTGTTGSQKVFTVNAAGDTMSKGNSQLGDSASDQQGVNRTPEALVGLSVDGPGAAGGSNYTVKFYSGGSLAAWIRKK